jgi:outer membrane beta-barrel protein
MRLLAAALLFATALPAFAQVTTVPARPGADQVVQPEVARREVRVPRYPSRDFSVDAFVGTYATQNFGASVVGGMRAGYHLTEDFFVEATLAQTKVSDENFRQILPGGVFGSSKETLRYWNLSAGWNVLPGEVFLGSKTAKASQIYLIGGVGSTSFVDQKKQTVNLGFGAKVYFSDRFSVRVDVRDHIFSLDLLGKRESTQNLEVSAGVAYSF